MYLHNKAYKLMAAWEGWGGSEHALAVVYSGHVCVSVQRSGGVHVGDVDGPLVGCRIDEHVEVEGQVHGQVL
jgi:hypothetical protein